MTHGPLQGGPTEGAVHPLGDVHQHGHAGGVAVGGIVVLGEPARQVLQQAQAQQHQQHHGQRGHDGADHTVVVHEEDVMNEHHDGCGQQRVGFQRVAEDGDAGQAAVGFGAHPGAVVVRQQHDLAGASPLGGFAFHRNQLGFVHRHHVLADALAQEAGEHGLADVLQHHHRGGSQGQYDGGQRQRLHHEGQERGQKRHAEADGLGGIQLGFAVHLFDSGGQAGIALQPLLDGRCRALLFLGAGGTRADFLG